MLQQIFTGILITLYSFVGDLGASIVLLTALIRTALLPVTIPTLKARKKLTKLQPKLKKLKNKFEDKKKLQKAQLELYQKYNVNPLAGCLPQILQLVVLFGLYRAMSAFLQQQEIQGVVINPQFLWLDLTKPDPYYILPILAGLVQLVLALMISPGAEVRDIVPNKAKSKKLKEKNKEEEDTAEMAQVMQQQMLFIMPVMTAVIALKFPSGLALYWVVTNLFSIGQQYFVSGWGGLKTYWQRLQIKINELRG